jgi:predicted dehydrogenase
MRKALIVGFGSIGQRHARVLKNLGLDVAVVSRRPISHAPAYLKLDEAVAEWNPDYVVIASRTNEHLLDVQTLLKAGFSGTVLLEKPVFMDSTSPPSVSAFKNIYTAYNLRFHPLIMSLKEALSQVEVYALHCHVGQYLPLWRPDQDYRTGYSARREQGGGVLRDLSHELDYLTWILGGWHRIAALGGQESHLEISSDDVFSILMETEKCSVVSIHMNYLDRSLRREIIAQTSEGTVCVDLAKGTIDRNGDMTTCSVGLDDTYIAQHQAIIEGNSDAACSFSEGLEIMHLIDSVETSTRNQAWIRRVDIH